MQDPTREYAGFCNTMSLGYLYKKTPDMTQRPDTLHTAAESHFPNSFVQSPIPSQLFHPGSQFLCTSYPIDALPTDTGLMTSETASRIDGHAVRLTLRANG